MDLTIYEVESDRVEVRPAPRRRAWMQETAGAAAYRCLPLTMANQHGWEMLCPYGFDVVWNGGPGVRDVVVRPDDPQAAARVPNLAKSHFATGILTFNPQMIVRTPPGHDLWVTGPSNTFKDGIQPMSALIEADWMPYTFAMNWKLTRPDVIVRFEKGDPFCFFFPVVRGLVEECEPRLAALGDAPELAKQYAWGLARRKLDEVLDVEPTFQGWYTKGKLPIRDSGDAPAHRTTVDAKPFKRRRDG